MYSTQEKDKRESFAVKISFIPNTLFSLKYKNWNWNYTLLIAEP